ncbi:MAG: hypothetical protein ACRD2E_08005 [Terriglobales bacterium]
MQTHLNAECADCLEAEQICRSAGTLLQAEPDYAPPPDVSRFITGAFAWARPRANRRLIFGQWFGGWQPLQAGLRGGAAGAQHAVYQAGDWVVDVRCELASGDRDATDGAGMLAGQVLHATEPNLVLADAPVSLRLRRRVLAVTRSNDLGEFQLILPPGVGSDCHLAIHPALTDGPWPATWPATLIIPLRILARHPGTPPSGASR